MSAEILRIIDANLNRIGEGLRVLEDLARLLLNDAGLTRQLKAMRHELIRGDAPFQQQLLQARDAEGDVGQNGEEPKQRDIPLTVVANARRVQESLRIMEELAKTGDTGPELDPDKFKQARFKLYTLEKDLLLRLTRQDRLKRLGGLYAIIDSQALKGRSHVETAGQAIRGGASTIQLRDKMSGKRDLLPIARQMKDLCKEHDVLFIVNDFLDIALASNADGLHLGPDDLPVKEARRLLPVDKILGRSARTVEIAAAARADGADYIATGAIYPTSSKATSVLVGLERLREIRQAIDLPLVAIGGIDATNAAEAIAAGADAVAVISAILNAENIETAARQIAARFEVQDEPVKR